MIVNVVDYPTVSLGDARQINAGEPLVITPTIVPAPAANVTYTYMWTRADGVNVTTSTIDFPIATVAMTGTYTVRVKNSTGCETTASVVITVIDASCTCKDCDLASVKDTENPVVPATNRGTTGKNFVQESVYMDAGGGSVAQTITYFDGLGRPQEKVSVGTGGGTAAADVYAIMKYDDFGREPKKYLPFAVGAANGAFRTPAEADVTGYYTPIATKTGNPFTSLTYESSPLNRVLTQTAPGATAAVSMAYRTNTAGEVKQLTVGATALTVGTYSANQLYVTETTDEATNKTIEYKDKEGRVVCKDVSGRKTLYGYDDFGRLRVVVPPLASGAIASLADPAANDLLFVYTYDARGRMTGKKVPGAGLMTMTYDNRDRLVTTTDAKNIVITTEYDDLDRVTATKEGGTLLTQNVYDRYGGEAKGFDTTHAYGVTNRAGVQGMLTSTKTLVLGTGTYLTSTTYYDDLGRVIQTVADNSVGKLDRASSKLDYIGRALETKLTTANSTTTLTVDSRTAYERGGRVKAVCQKVSDNQPSAVAGASDATRFYWEPIARHTYNGIGELMQKTLGCNVQKVDYTYQMRGWLTGINNPTSLAADKDFFGMNLAYDAVGNITQWNYRNGQTQYGAGNTTTILPGLPYAYSFTYDRLNRLTSGVLNNGSGEAFRLGGADNGLMNYDDNGNIQSLKRTLQGTVVDNLAYTYKNSGQSNQLERITDDGGTADFAKASQYSYDANGNLTGDVAKNITGIDYNYLNLPGQITRSTGGNITYTYAASGQKLKAAFPAVGTTPARRYDYVGGMVYENDRLEFIPTAEGRVLPPGRAETTTKVLGQPDVTATNKFYRYEYQLKDHLGNLRVACRCGEKTTEATPAEAFAPQVVQEQHYDPWGLNLSTLSSLLPLNNTAKPVVRFNYNGIEEQGDLGTYMAIYRSFDPSISRWWSVDPKPSQSHTTYGSANGNPIINADPLGDTIIVNKVGTVISNNKKDNLVFAQGNKGKLMYLGELGKKINIGYIYRNLLKQNMKIAEGIYSPFTFKNLVQAKGDWDLKVNNKTIYGLGNDGKTQFLFEGKSMEAQDIGNHHFGAVANAYGFGEVFALKQAGIAQMSSGTSKAEWQIYGPQQIVGSTPAGPVYAKPMLAPYGDDPRDQSYIKEGYQYYNTHQNE
ncbi:DUF6443 domain-containing protein [Fibrella aquatilis]|uniref:RHS repeat-associated core domain-containing protein n=1 Tax=Fibrella aquatilis TaxID=2817059 RepID=A0A939JYK4_9BACT|nr:DUF6443 domain-containing protein [Fibrella aquatilis]MBO0934102.1 hypothetical protein [Fibrella aquatilis]